MKKGDEVVARKKHERLIPLCIYTVRDVFDDGRITVDNMPYKFEPSVLRIARPKDYTRMMQAWSNMLDDTFGGL